MWTVASSKSRPFARCAIADAITSATASGQARRLRRARPRERKIIASPSASATVRAASGTPGGSTPLIEVGAVGELGRQRRDDRDHARQRGGPRQGDWGGRATHRSHGSCLRCRTLAVYSSARRSSSSLPGSRIASTWSPISSWVSSSGISALPARTTEISRAPSGQLERADRACPGSSRPCRPSPRRSRGSPCAARAAGSARAPGTSCSIRPMIAPVAETVGEIPSRSKYAWLRGSLMRAITLPTP